MRIHKQLFTSITLAALLFSGFAASGIAQDTTTMVNPEANTPVILTTTPADGEINVDVDSVIEITFSSVMDETTINANTLQLHANAADSMHKMHEMHGDVMRDDKKKDDNDRAAQKDSEKDRHSVMRAVKGTISYSNNVAVFTPNEDLKEGTQYTFTVTNGVKSSANRALENEHTWSFTTSGASDSAYSGKQNDNYGIDRNRYDDNAGLDRNRYGDNAGLDRNRYDANASDTTQNGNTNIDLGKAGQFVILAKETINNESGSRITGQTGEGSAADKMKKEMEFTDSVRQRVPGQVMVWQSNKTDTTSANVSEAIGDMMAAYSDVSMQNGFESAWHNERFEDSVMTSGIYEWSESLHIESDVTLSGGADDVWIIKVGDNLTVDENTVFTLTNGARAENIFWYVEGEVTIGKNARFEGIILSMNEITLEKGAKMNGRMFSQTSITLDDNTVTEPGSMTGHTSSSNR